MTIEAIVASSATAQQATQAGVAGGDFSAALARSRETRATESVTDAEGQGGLLGPLLNLNTDSARLAETAGEAAAREMRPGELMMLTVQSHEFLFHCQLVSNVANRSADGVQQLFRQQS